MAAPATTEDFLDLVQRSNQVEKARLEAFMSSRREGPGLPGEPRQLAALMVREGLLTNFQAEQLLQGKWRGFALGGYRILERLGAGGTGTVYLAEHQVMRRRVAIKVLPADYANAPGVLERFQREAQAVAALDHPNIVRAYDFRSEGTLHFLVMEYVEGVSLQELLVRTGPLALAQAVDYARQAALGLEHAHEAGLVHRDVKPANLLVDRAGTVKLLDLGLARYSPTGQDSLTKQFDDNAVMGTADYLSPEQALNLHAVDIRADIYSLGATLYALLAGQPPFHAGTVTQKLLWHQLREPTPLLALRQDVPEEVVAVIGRMMAKAPEDRYPTPTEVVDALAPWAEGPYPPVLPGQPSSAEGSGVIVMRARSADRTSPQVVATPRSSSVATMPRLEPAPEPDGPPVVTADRPVARSSARVWLAVFGVSAAVLVLTAITIVGVFLWRAVKSAKPTIVAPAKPDEDERGPDVPVQAAFELPDGNGELFALDGHTGPVPGVAFSPNGDFALSASADRTIRLWDLKDRKLKSVLAGHGDQVSSVVFSGDAQRALSASFDQTVRVWELPGGKELAKFPGHTGRVFAAVYSPDDREVLSASADKTLRLWEFVPNRRFLREFKGHNQDVICVAFAPAPRRQALSGGLDNLMRLWDVNNANHLRQYPGHTGPVTGVAFLPDGGRALSVSRDGTLRFWEVDSGRPLHTFAGHTGPIWAVAVSGDGKRALTGGEDRTMRLWDLEARRELQAYPGHAAITAVAFSANGRHAVSGGRDKIVRVWALRR
jgi:WD40 repeat protein/serine/threonine protein kinase